MEIREIKIKNKNEFNSVVSHPLQSFEWGEFREKTGIKVIRRGFFEKGKLVKGFTLTIHKIPHTPWFIGYLPKGDLPDQKLIDELQKIGKDEKCIFIQLEPNVIKANTTKSINENSDFIENCKLKIKNFILVAAAHPLFTKYTFVLDLTKSEEELLKAMHPKARYNIRVAKKHGVEIIEDNSEKAFEEYWRLMEETTNRQNFYAHTKKYHKILWEILNVKNSKQIQNSNDKNSKLLDHSNLEHLNIVSDSCPEPVERIGFRISDFDKLTSHLFLTRYKGKILTAWTLFIFKDTLYYPYGASSNENREVMASNLIMWESIRFGKKLGLKKFDMWGALGPIPDTKDPWYGFHNFKEKYGPTHVEFIGSFDLVIKSSLYQLYKLADRLRWLYLKMKIRS